jgi:Tfp pilus assembly protein PilN
MRYKLLDPQKGIIGISIAPGRVFITQLKHVEGKWHIDKAVQAEISPESVRDGLIFNADKVAGAIKNALRDNDIKARQVIMGVSGIDTIMRTVEMPEMPKAEMKEALKVELDKYMLSGEETIIDYYPVGKERVFFVALKKSIAVAILSLSEKAGLNLVGIDIFPLAVLRALSLGNVDLTSKNATLLVLVGDKKTDMGMVTGGVLAFSRSVDTIEVYELVKEIETISTYWAEQFPGISLEKIVVLGDTEKAEMLRNELPKEPAAIERGKPLGEEVADFDLSRSASIGMAMRRWEEKRIFDINLIPPEKLRKIELERKFLTFFVALSVILLTLFGVNLTFTLALSLYERKLIPIQKELARSPELLDEIKRINAERSYVLDNMGLKEEFIDQAETVPWPQVLTDIKNFIPDEVWLTEISSGRDGTLILRGRAYSQDAVYKYVHLLSFSDCFYEPNLAHIKGREEKDRSIFDFDIICPLTEESTGAE